MPTPERTSLTQIVAAGCELLETEGAARLTMQAVAAKVGVRAPSLYKRVRDRDALLSLVAAATTDELGRRLAAAEPTVAGVASAFRAFAHERPEGFRLLQSSRVDPESLALASAPVLRLTAELAGEADALDAARLLTAWATGFLTMELSGAFRLGGDLDSAFAYGVGKLTAVLRAGG